MPIYEYCCRSCHHAFEELVSASAADNGSVACPECDSRKVERMLSSFSFKSAGGGGAASMGKSNCGSCAKTSCNSCG
ncbi:MAG: FmdB family zinc ribbon protein [Thermoleophilia bacterium]